MKIIGVRVRSFPYRRAYPIANSLRMTLTDNGTTTVVEVITDDGITGVAAAQLYDREGQLLIANQLKDQIVGEDPLNYQLIWHKMLRSGTMWCAPYLKGKMISCMSVIDTAIWDIIAKKQGVPLITVLGGYRDEIPCYASGGHYYTNPTSHEEELRHLAWEMEKYMQMGFKAVKMRLGRDVIRDCERTKVIREVIGPRTKLLVDFNNSPSRYGGAFHALKFIRALEPYDIYWFEDPLLMDDIAGLKQIADSVDTAIAIGESEQTRWGFREVIEKRAVDILLPDAASMCGGVTEWLKIASLAEAYHMPVAAHIGDDVHLHCVAAVPNGLMVEVFAPLDTDRLLYSRHPVAGPNSEGMLSVPQRPGTGLELDTAYVNKHGKDVK